MNLRVLLISFILIILFPVDIVAETLSEETILEEEEVLPPIPDPIEPLNRAIFHFNDRLYFWVLKPIAEGYNKIVPEGARVGVRRFFLNLGTPVRFVNSLLQFKGSHAGIELTRFAINTTIGVLGFMDPARERWGLSIHREDLGQTFGFHGVGPGFYLILPLMGPSSLRDTIGMVGDFLLDPTIYLLSRNGVLATYGYWQINEISLEIGGYESIKEGALDPYISIRDIYHQHRQRMIKE